MARLGITIKYHGELGRREYGKATKEAFVAAGRLWHQKFRPKHFTKAGAREYRYAPRTRSYTARKFREFGHRLPLVWSGETRNLARNRKIKATAKMMRVIINAPTLNRLGKGKNSVDIDMRDEMTRVSTRERRAMVNLFARVFDRRLKASSTTRVRRVA